MFQVPSHYLTARENMAGESGSVEEKSFHEKLPSLRSDQLIGRLPKGYDNLLGRWFRGIELSGEWQRWYSPCFFAGASCVSTSDELMDPGKPTGIAHDIPCGTPALLATHRLTIAMTYSDEGRADCRIGNHGCCPWGLRQS
jgi:hypothetical protein